MSESNRQLTRAEANAVASLRKASAGFASLVKTAEGASPVPAAPQAAPVGGAGTPPADPAAKFRGQFAGQLLNSLKGLSESLENWDQLQRMRGQAQKEIGTTFVNFQRAVSMLNQKYPNDPMTKTVVDGYRNLTKSINIKNVAPQQAISAIQQLSQAVQQASGAQSGTQGLPQYNKQQFQAPAAQEGDKHYKAPNGFASSTAKPVLQDATGAVSPQRASYEKMKAQFPHLFDQKQKQQQATQSGAFSVPSRTASTLPDVSGKFSKTASGWSWNLATTEDEIASATRDFVTASVNLIGDKQGTTKLAQAIPNLTSPVKNYQGNEADVEVGPDSGKKEIGYSAQATAAEELHGKLKALQQTIQSIRPAYDAVRKILTDVRETFHPEFNSALHPSVHKTTVNCWAALADKLLQTMPPFTDVAKVIEWTKTVEQHIGKQVGSLMDSTRVVDQRNTLRRFWDKSFGKAFGQPKAAPAPAATPAPEQKAASGKVVWRAF